MSRISPGWGAAAETRGETLQLIREAIEFHMEENAHRGIAGFRAFIEHRIH